MTCGKKYGFPSRRTAKAYARRRSLNYRVYLCDVCPGTWHMTSQPSLDTEIMRNWRAQISGRSSHV